MTPTQETPPTTPKARDDIEFLANSWTRLDVLEALRTEPLTRDELREITSVSRVTLSRILSDLETRGWVVKEDAQYETTTAGEFIANEITRLLDNLQTLHRLDENVEWIHLDQFDFDLRCLHDANIIMPSWDDFSAQTRTLVELVEASSAIKGIGTGLDREFMQALADATVNGELYLDLIFVPDVIEAITNEPELTRLFHDVAAAPSASLYRYLGDEPVMELGIHESAGPDEDVVMLCGEYEDGAPPGTVESTDPQVRQWAERYFEARRANARLLDADVFTP